MNKFEKWRRKIITYLRFLHVEQKGTDWLHYYYEEVGGRYNITSPANWLRRPELFIPGVLSFLVMGFISMSVSRYFKIEDIGNGIFSFGGGFMFFILCRLLSRKILKTK